MFLHHTKAAMHITAARGPHIYSPNVHLANDLFEAMALNMNAIPQGTLPCSALGPPSLSQ